MRPDTPGLNSWAVEPCPACGSASGFAWADRTVPEVEGIVASLRPVRPLRWGSLHRCSVCGCGWYLDGFERRMRRVPPDRQSLLEAWDAEPSVPTPAQREALATIGATGRDGCGRHDGTYRVPCGIRWDDGTGSDPCLVVVSRDPPLDAAWLRVRLFRAVAALRPTTFALPPDVRCATLRAPERAPGFAPTAVEGGGRRFLLDGAADLFGHVGLRGQDLRLVDGQVSSGDPPPLVGQPLERTTVVQADWFEGCEALLLDAARDPNA